MSQNTGFKSFITGGQSGNSAVFALIALAVIALGGLAYFSGNLPGVSADGEKPGFMKVGDALKVKTADESVKTPAGDVAAADANAAPPIEIKPGNPTVATVNGEEVKRLEVLGFIQSLPPQTRQMPLEQLFPLAVNQLVNAKIIQEKTKDVKLDSDPEVQKQLALAKDQIVRGVYLQKMVDAKIDESRLKADYDTYVANFPKIEEVKAAHILVKEQSKAKDLIRQLEGGANFADLAKANSVDATAANGGDLGFFAQTDVVPAFGKAAFETAPGSFTKDPVKTDFGYHIIRVDEKRQRPAADYETAKPFLEAEARRQVMQGILDQWQKEGDIKRFDINGDPMKIEPAAGGLTVPPPPGAPAGAPPINVPPPPQ